MESKKNIIITGGSGCLGTELTKMLKSKTSELGSLPAIYDQFDILSLASYELDITNLEHVSKILEENRPYAVINCAAYTDVDGCEDEKDKAFRVNALGPRNLAIACEKKKAKLLHISTDYVFDGEEKEKRVESDRINPKSVYGASKAFGEEYVKNFCSRWYILRTSWLYGYHGKNFVNTIIKAAKENGVLNVVDDQIGSPTNAVDLAYAICKLLVTQEYGLYHCSGNGECSWYEFACEILKVFGIDAKINPCKSSEYKRKAKRPKFSNLDNFMLRLTVGDCFRDWKQALSAFCNNGYKS